MCAQVDKTSGWLDEWFCVVKLGVDGRFWGAGIAG